MRFRLAIAVTLAAIVIGYWTTQQDSQGPARFDGAIDLPRNAITLGGFSGLSIGADGQSVTLISDRGRLVRGQLDRIDGRLSNIKFTDRRPLLDEAGQPVKGRDNDAEGVAIGTNGTMYVSFEGNHRLTAYVRSGASARTLPRHRDFQHFPGNGGIEALAIDTEGHLLAIPERRWTRQRHTPVYLMAPDGWSRVGRYPSHLGYLPVGADFGPDGRLYVLERHFKGLGFASQVRSFRMTPRGLVDPQLEMRSPPRRHGNLEGISVWQDQQGYLRLTMVSDDNFLMLLPSEIVEYVLPKTLAKQGNQD